MREIFKTIIKVHKDLFWIPGLTITKEDVFFFLYRFVIAAMIWSLNLVLYFSMIITATVLIFLLGGGEYGFWEFTRAYFYDGHMLNFIAWRCHIVLYGCCLVVAFNNALYN